MARMVMMTAGLVAGAAAMLVVAAATGQPAPAAPPAAAGALPAGPGHDTMVRVCSTCHAPEIAATQRLGKDGWHELVDTMAGRGAQGSDADFAEIEAYLYKNFPDQPPAK